MSIELPNVPKMNPLSRIRRSRRILISGQRVTFERTGREWIATGWENGLPVARRPITENYLRKIVSGFPAELLTFRETL